MRNLGKYLLLLFVVLMPLQAKKSATFSFKMESDKSEAYLGEPVRIRFLFRYPIDTQIAEANFAPPTFHDFWVKPGKKVPDTIEKGYHEYRLDYLIIPQRSGKIEIEPARMDIGILKKGEKNTLRFDRVKWKSIFSNGLTLSVKPLPEGASLFGNYTIEAKVDRNETRANHPVNLTVTVKGSGNIEEIPDFEITSGEAVVYADKPVIKTRFTDGLSEGVFRQKFAFVSDRNFTIPALSLTYFDSATRTIKRIKTEPIPVTVESDRTRTAAAHLEKGEERPSVSYRSVEKTVWILSTLAAFAAGVILTLLFRRRPKPRSEAQKTLQERIRKARSDKALLQILLPYAQSDIRIARIVEKLEQNLYEGASHRIDRKKVAKLFRENVTDIQHDADILL